LDEVVRYKRKVVKTNCFKTKQANTLFMVANTW